LARATTSPAEARSFVELHLTQHELSYLVEDIRLVVSELVTNSVIHATTEARVRIEQLPFCVKLTVYDESAELPVLRPESRTADHAEGGRGLCIIDACSLGWGADLDRGSGKSLWALFAVRPESSWVA
jgi:anti-sigma regulatory factor (Ser/Thr protein kinase)